MGTGKTKRVFTRDFKLTLARQLVSGDRRMSQICREHSLCESVVRRWKLHYERNGEASWTETAIPLSAGSSARSASDVVEAVVSDRVKELEAALGRAHLEIEFLKLALEKKPSTLGRALK